VDEVDKLISEMLEKKPWMNKKTKAGVDSACSNKNKQIINLLTVLSQVEGKALSNVLDVFGNDEEILLAVIIQNSMAKQNRERTQAIKDGNYTLIESKEDAVAFLRKITGTQLTHAFNKAKADVLAVFASSASAANIDRLVSSPDVYVCAVAMSRQSFCNGQGHRTKFIQEILSKDPAQIPDLARKLKLLTSIEVYGRKLFCDKGLLEEKISAINRKWVYRLWFHCCRLHEVVTLDEMIVAFPFAEDLLVRYDRFVDKQGRTTLNLAEYQAYRE